MRWIGWIMKHLCCSRFIFVFLFVYSSLFGALSDKSAIVYYGDKISYPMVGIHDYIIVQPDLTNTNTHGFSVYKEKMYAYVSIGEIDKTIPEYKKIKKEWILAENKVWDSKVLDIKNPQYQHFLFNEMIEPKIKAGFKNFFFDTIDSYHIVAKTDKQRADSEKALALFINTFHKKYPHAKLIINRGFEIIDKVHNSLEAVLFESYYYGLGEKKLNYKEVDKSGREWLDVHINKIKSYGLNIIAVDYLENPNSELSKKIVDDIKLKGMIPYVARRELDTYGKSSKNPIKREILTLIDESQYDRIFLGAHQYGALPLEYMGYIQKLYDVSKNTTLPKMKDMNRYAGVIVWLTKMYKKSDLLIQWILDLQEIGVRVVFVDNFGMPIDEKLEKLDIKVSIYDDLKDKSKKIIVKDSMIGYEIEPYIPNSMNYLELLKGKALFTLSDAKDNKSTMSALMPWGGYVLSESFMIELGKDNIWIINPFDFFQQALNLKPLLVPDPTTHNGKRLLFTHIDGDGIMNRVEWNPSLFSGDTILNDILKRYKIPHSVSVIGAEIDDNGLYPKIASKLQNIAKKMYKLENVEGATHTFTHPFFWNKIVNDNLSSEYRLKVKGYKFSLDREIKGSLQDINTKLLPKGKPLANIVFWSGDCAPTEIVLDNIYKNKILNINGGDTYISNSNPWLSYIAPYGLERGEYYQVYTGAQNENVFTNNWLGPFWGFKKVVQTFKLTNSPRRFKPIDIYYHLYSGSKRASLNALKYVFDWSIKQDVMPIFTSEYIPKVMDYYTVSMAEEDDIWLFDGMRNLKTVRIEEPDVKIDINKSQNILGFNHFENHTYIHLYNKNKALISKKKKGIETQPYLISANGEVTDYYSTNNKFSMSLKGHVDLKFEVYIPSECKVELQPKIKTEINQNILSVEYKNNKKASLNVICKL